MVAQTIPVDAPTGRWQVEFRTDPDSKDATQGLTFRIEEFLPERLKLDLSNPRDDGAEARRTAASSRSRATISTARRPRGNRFTAQA